LATERLQISQLINLFIYQYKQYIILNSLATGQQNSDGFIKHMIKLSMSVNTE